MLRTHYGVPGTDVRPCPLAMLGETLMMAARRARDINVNYCDPQSPRRPGSNEKTNGLLRQYFSKGIDLSAYSQAKLNAVAGRSTLDFETPDERFHQFVASTG